ncbi:ABC transporter ATP-binding protein [Ancylobacter defluvii]|uniref:Fe3+/spermidine/putrescine ABC transporter ATP-binding protein n=1 Tax=Ancylobacter defluvii TaxID=1282440 RepID=A0A9W6JYI9_9HYPH|nr:ABC transporter ATP-binding protein [Ancylobacter defluvii]MBS7589216.1 ABC transporter ATP-binding protein [Ancylobacter defluvii]GLK84828.1 Fe3+/spermidine/putrescine ABC transporter ATP-binding protein [Ancylobacter defluvii]
MPSDSSPAVSVRGLGLCYGRARILDDVGFDVAPGKVLALLGPSGCGKTTLLQLLAGLLAPSAGRIEILGAPVADAALGRFVPPEARGLGMVFQDYALWPHMSVAANVAFPLEMRGVPAAERRVRVAVALERVGLGAMAERRPSDMSGGQQQRVALARAIVAEPPLVLFDEPLSNLDPELREAMVGEIGALVAQLGLTAIYVTHDRTEAFALADEVAVMRGGRIAQLAAPEALIAAPASPEVAEFLNLGCVLPVRRAPEGWLIDGTAMLVATGGPDAQAARLLLPRRATLIGPAVEGRPRADVVAARFRGDGHVLTLRICGTELDIQVTSPRRVAPGEVVGLFCPPQDLRWFADPTTPLPAASSVAA